MQPAISIQNLGKKYTLADSTPYFSLRDSITDFAKKMFRHRQIRKEFWALEDINLIVEPGERVGVIGRNGAGKSTLLKIISRITPPTKGSATIRGRVGSLLEVGTGFHPELSGLENIYLNGSILGLRRAEIRKQLDAIIDFSGVENFLNNPLKHYSSGMQLRLAFSVAAHLEPEILLIDEVLAVGDAEFQKKCLGKMEEVSNKHGRTIVFVSHDLNAIARLTTSCVLLDKGKILSNGDTATTLAVYQRHREKDNYTHITESQKSKPQINNISIITSGEDSVQKHGSKFGLQFELDIPGSTKDIALSFQIMNRNMQPVLHFWVVDSNEISFKEKGKYTLNCTVPVLNLYQGNYSVNAYLGENKGKEVFHFVQDAVPFEVIMAGLEPGHSFGWQENSCVYREEHSWGIQKH